MEKFLKEQVSLIDQGNFEQWPGINRDLTMKMFEDTTGTKLDCDNHILSGTIVSRCLFPLQHQSQPLQIFTDSEGKIRLLRIEDARPAISLKKLFEQLGEPDFTRPLTYPDRYSPATQRVYASKGITLYVLDESPGSSLPLSAISLYEPTTTDNYLSNLGGREIKRVFRDDRAD